MGTGDSMTLKPDEIERIRVQTGMNGLCELALDGLRFRAWINGCRQNPGAVVKALAPCSSPQEHRRAIDGLIAAGKIAP